MLLGDHHGYVSADGLGLGKLLGLLRGDCDGYHAITFLQPLHDVPA